MFIQQCVVCEKDFLNYPSGVHRRKCCSRECYGKWRTQSLKGENNPNWRGGAIIICKHCGKEFSESPNRVSVRRYCSRKCQGAATTKGKEQPCENCGKIFVSGSRKNLNRFCCHKCAEAFMRGKNSPHWLGGDKDYPETFNKEFKDKIRKRDNYTCAICKGNGRAVHHINYVKMDTTPENCITLCQSCHIRTNSNRSYWIEYFANLSR